MPRGGESSSIFCGAGRWGEIPDAPHAAGGARFLPRKQSPQLMRAKLSSSIDAEAITLDPRPSSRSALAVFGGKPRTDLPNRRSPLDDGSHAHPSESQPSRAPAYSPDDCPHRAVLTRHLLKGVQSNVPGPGCQAGGRSYHYHRSSPAPVRMVSFSTAGTGKTWRKLWRK